MKLLDIFKTPTAWELKRRMKCKEIKDHIAWLYPQFQHEGSWEESHGGETCTFHGTITDPYMYYEIQKYEGWLNWWQQTCIEEIIMVKGIDHTQW